MEDNKDGKRKGNCKEGTSKEKKTDCSACLDMTKPMYPIFISMIIMESAEEECH